MTEFCPSCGEHPNVEHAGRCYHCTLLEGGFAACEHSLQVPDRFSSSDRLHMKLLSETNPAALGRMFARAFATCIAFGKTVPWDEETEHKALVALARDIFLSPCALDPVQGKVIYDSITWPEGMEVPRPEKIIPFYGHRPEPGCDECRGTGWYVGLHERRRCRTCL